MLRWLIRWPIERKQTQPTRLDAIRSDEALRKLDAALIGVAALLKLSRGEDMATHDELISALDRLDQSMVQAEQRVSGVQQQLQQTQQTTEANLDDVMQRLTQLQSRLDSLDPAAAQAAPQTAVHG